MYFYGYFETDVLISFFVLTRWAEMITWENFIPAIKWDPGNTKEGSCLVRMKLFECNHKRNLWRVFNTDRIQESRTELFQGLIDYRTIDIMSNGFFKCPFDSIGHFVWHLKICYFDPCSVIIFLSQTTLLKWLTFLLRSLTVTLTVLLFWISFFLLILVFVLQWLSLHWEILIVLSQFPLSSHHIHNGVPCFIAMLMTILVLIGMVFIIIWKMFHERISLNSVLLLQLVSFASGFRLELMYISLIESIRSSLTHLHGFQLLVLLHRDHFFHFTKRIYINLLNLK